MRGQTITVPQASLFVNSSNSSSFVGVFEGGGFVSMWVDMMILILLSVEVGR